MWDRCVDSSELFWLEYSDQARLNAVVCERSVFDRDSLVFYFHEEKKLRNEFKAGGASERIRTEWELDYIVSKKTNGDG